MLAALTLIAAAVVVIVSRSHAKSVKPIPVVDARRPAPSTKGSADHSGERERDCDEAEHA